jgi:proteic killer suppression protein
MQRPSVVYCSPRRYGLYMRVRSIAHKGLRRLYEEHSPKGLNADPEELRALPLWKAHALTGDRKGTWSLHVTRNWRMTFRIEDGEIVDLSLEDYH